MGRGARRPSASTPRRLTLENLQMNQEPDDRYDSEPRFSLVRVERDHGYGSVPGLEDEELADPAELERQAMIADWGPILALPVKPGQRRVRPPYDQEGK